VLYFLLYYFEDSVLERSRGFEEVGWYFLTPIIIAHLPVRHPLGALDGGLKGDSPGDFWVLGSYASKASSYHSLRLGL